MANKTAIIMMVILTVLGLVISMSIISGTSSDLIDAADSITDANNCSQFTGWEYNITGKTCTNTTSGFEQTAGQIDLPLNAFFSSSGITYLVLMAFMFIGLVMFIIVKTKAKS